MTTLISPNTFSPMVSPSVGERLYRDMLQSLPMAVYTCDTDGRITFCNEAAVEFAGRRPQPEDRWNLLWRMRRPDGTPLPHDECPMAVTLRTGRAVTGAEAIAECPDGMLRPYMPHPTPLFDDGGALIGAVNVLVDVSGQKNADRVMLQLNETLAELIVERTRQADETAKELHRTERNFELLVRSVVDYAIFMLDTDGNVASWNAGAERIKGYRADEIVGRHFSCFYTSEDRAGSLPARALSAARNEGRYVADGWRLRRDGSRFWASVVIDPIHDDDGRLVGYAKVTRDITERKAAELALIESERLARGVIDSALDGFVQTAADGRVMEWNGMAEAIFGWPRHEALNKHFAALVMSPADQQRYRDNLTLATGAGQRWQTGALRRDGTQITVELGFSMLRLESGTVVNVFVRDITDKISIEAQLRQSQKMEAVGQLTGGIAHDFNNLLQGITGALELVEQRIQENRTDNLSRFVTGALSSAQRAAALTHRLLAFSRRQPLDPRAVSANPLLVSMQDLLRRTIGPHIDIAFDLSADLWSTHCDTNQLENAVLNLAINARDAMPQGGRLTIGTRNLELDSASADRHGLVPGQYVCICVTDTGVGMPPEVIERAFDPFFTTKTMGQGTGLGLSMVYGFAGQSKGHCRIESETGKGTSVRIYLPRQQGAPASDEAVPAAQTEAARRAAGEVVLVVEDESSVRQLIVHVLDELGYTAVEAADGVSGLEILRSPRRIDLLITDIGLPGLNGRQMADAALIGRPGLKVLLMTGYAESVVAPEGMLDPGMELIIKPFPMDALATRIRSMIPPRHAGA